MPKPVASGTSNEPLDCHVDENEQPLACVSKPSEPNASTTEPAQSSASSAGTQSLVARFSPPPALPKPAASVSSPVISFSVGTTSSGVVPGGGSYRFAAQAGQAQVTRGAFKGSTLEVGKAQFQYGKDNDVQVTAARQVTALSGHGFGMSVTAQAGAVRANLGENNDDGSIGGNIGAAAEAYSVEATIDTPVGSLTYGQGVSIGAGGSMGVRDADHDGKPEFCAKFSIPAYTVGACVEQFW